MTKDFPPPVARADAVELCAAASPAALALPLTMAPPMAAPPTPSAASVRVREPVGGVSSSAERSSSRSSSFQSESSGGIVEAPSESRVAALQLRSKLLACTPQSRHRRADRQLEQLGDFALGQLLE